MFARENTFDDLILKYGTQFNVPAWVIKTTIGKESSFNPAAYRAEPTINDASRGLMQVLEKTARALGLKGDVGNDTTKTGGLYEPTLNIQLGTKLLGQLRDRYPGEGWDAIYSAYQHGSIARDAATGLLSNERIVNQWRTIADYFNPPWRGTAGPSPPFRSTPGSGRPPRG